GARGGGAGGTRLDRHEVPAGWVGVVLRRTEPGGRGHPEHGRRAEAEQQQRASVPTPASAHRTSLHPAGIRPYSGLTLVAESGSSCLLPEPQVRQPGIDASGTRVEDQAPTGTDRRVTWDDAARGGRPRACDQPTSAYRS